jgi:RNA polymerase sigma factor (sigma-70 family)
MMVGARSCDLRPIQALFGGGSVTAMTDEQLLEEFLTAGDAKADAAFAALVAFHGPMVWSVCRGVLRDLHDAEDAFQVTFLLLVRKAGSIRGRATLGPWLHGVARRVAVRAKLSATRRALQERLKVDVGEVSEVDLLRREELDAMHEELGRLPRRYRAALVLCHLQGLTHAEAALRLKCPKGTVSVRVARARELLRERLTRRGISPSAVVGLERGSRGISQALPLGLAEATGRAVMHVAAGKTASAAGVSAAVGQLLAGILGSMAIKKSVIGAIGLLVTALAALGIGILSTAVGPAHPRRDGGVVPLLTVSGPVGEKQSDPRPLNSEEETKARRLSLKHLRTIALAMYQFTNATADGRFPPAAISADGKPLLSWRVALLPCLGERALYDMFRLDEPWDSPHNKPLVERMPAVFCPVIAKGDPIGFTYYQIFSGAGAMFEGDVGPSTKGIVDGPSLTAMVAEAARPVPWTKPEDVPYESDKPLPKLGGQFEQGFHLLFADGSAVFLSKKIEAKILRALITARGSEDMSKEVLPEIPAHEGKD